VTFAEKLERSRIYEVAFASWLQSRGWYTLAAYDYSGKADDKAPRLMCGNTGLVTPDIFAVQLDKRAWFEVKLKSNADLYRKTNTLVTGLPLRHWQHYHDVKALTDMPVWIVFIHEAEETVVTAEIDDIATSHTYTGSSMDRGGTIFFIFEKLRPVTTLHDLRNYIKG
jgi:hypothetical protein